MTQPQGSWSEPAVRVLNERYRWKENGEYKEDLDGIFRRVADAVAGAERVFAPDLSPEVETMIADEFYGMMVRREFLPNSPTLMNAGKGNGQGLSACFVLPIDDSLENIFDTIKYAAIIHQQAGGTGFSFSKLREKGAVVRRTNGTASGPVSFLRVFNAATEQIKQGGSRRGANMAILDVDHPDILEFIDCKRPDPVTGLRDITNFNVSVAITDAFIQAYEIGTPYNLYSRVDGRVIAQLDARDVMDKIAASAWETGDPGLFFIDVTNRSASNPILGECIEATNPCGEEPIGAFDACNLGSINLAQFVVKSPDGADHYVIDWPRLDGTVREATRFLDNVIQINPYPLPQIMEQANNTRRIGLGVMGWADLLFLLKIPYNSGIAQELGASLMQRVDQVSWETSEGLAWERGPFPYFHRSIYKDGPPRRNSTVTTVAPTGTISIFADCSSGIEPVFALAFTHVVDRGKPTERKLIMANPIFERIAREEGFYSEALMAYVSETGTVQGFPGLPEWVYAVFVIAQEIDFASHVKMQAAFQTGVESAISKTINLPNDATVEDIKAAYLLAYKLGCKGITVFRDGCLATGQVLNIGKDSKRAEEPKSTTEIESDPITQLDTFTFIDPNATITRPENGFTVTIPAGLGQELVGHPLGTTKDFTTLRVRGKVVSGYTTQIEAPEGTVNITINSNQDGPFEVFINVGKAGSDIAALAEALGRLISYNLRIPSGLSPEERLQEIGDQLRGIGGSRSIGFGPNRVLSLPDAIAKALEAYPEVAPIGTLRAQQGEQETAVAPDPAGPVAILTIQPKVRKTGNVCPSCQSTSAYVLSEGCSKCLACGYSQC